MKEIPFVVEVLYFHWVTIPPKNEWLEEYEQISEDQVEKMYAFYKGLCLGMRLSEACREI